MNRPVAETLGLSPFEDAALGITLAGRARPVQIVGPGLHGLAIRLISDGVSVGITVSSRRDTRAFRRALRHAGCTAGAPTVADLRIDLPVADAAYDVLVCRLDPRAFPFPRHTVRELGRALAPGGLMALLPGAEAPWPTGLVDTWAASANLAPRPGRDTEPASPFAGSLYELRA